MSITNPSEVADSKQASPDATRKKSFEAERWALIVVWIVLIIVFSYLAPETFPTTSNVSNMLGSQAVLLILTLGLIVALRAGVIDLSIGGILTLSAMSVAVLNVQFGWSVWAAAGVALVVSVVVGVINGYIVVRFDIDPLIITLGTGTFVLGVTQFISNSRVVVGIDPSLSRAMLYRPILAIPIDFFYALGLCLFLWYLFGFTAFGQRLLFVGQNREVARLNGVDVDRARMAALVCSALGAGLAGVVFAGTTGSADPTSGSGFLLPAFAAAFLGSTAIKIGRFNPWGTLVAVYFLVTGITGLQLLGAQQYVQQLFYGGALVIAVILSKYVRARSEHSSKNV